MSMSKRISLYGLLTALCLVFGFLESMLSLSFLAPGIKLGLANSIALLLAAKWDAKGAFAVNLTRILLSALLFSSPSSLFFSLPAGLLSVLVMTLLARSGRFGTVGFSIAGAVVHNLTQLTAACLLFGVAVLVYLPLLLLSAAVSGTAIGWLGELILKKIKTNGS